ncbi:glycosyltransferase [Photobacterium toruni]|uniref:Glycosyltransferase n=1 Tax=Photobacterium toruni TaxID=1935446 RepID=A0ABU6L5N0_9GAMM|nr:glycosyltransferase [Photobacterium toruni]
MKHIIFISPTHNIYGGGQVYIEELAKNLLRINNNISVNIFSSDDLMDNSQLIPQINTWPKLICNIFTIIREIKNREETIVILNDINLSMLSILFKISGVRVVSLLHMDVRNSTLTGIKKTILVFLRKLLIKLGADIIFHVNVRNLEYLKSPSESFLGNFYSSPNKEIIPIRLEREKEFDFVFVGRMSSEKDPIRFVLLIKEYMLTYKKNVNVAMVGGGDLLQKVKDKIVELNLSSSIKVFDMQSRYNTIDIISKSKLLLITSKTEGFPTVILEAASVHVPCLCPNLGSVPYIFNKYNIGGLYEIDNMLPAMYSLTHGNRVDPKNFEQFLSDFSIDNVSLKFLSLLNL